MFRPLALASIRQKLTMSQKVAVEVEASPYKVSINIFVEEA
jgi:hypothetical protein